MSYKSGNYLPYQHTNVRYRLLRLKEFNRSNKRANYRCLSAGYHKQHNYHRKPLNKGWPSKASPKPQLQFEPKIAA
ncbi:hypothetical protein [Fodinibius sp. AD559]|uniref:hypothetical protein n=1 Tax=Fodinibius sp. AD559 TaxID=3424179 RepID=UPI004046CAB9